MIFFKLLECSEAHQGSAFVLQKHSDWSVEEDEGIDRQYSSSRWMEKLVTLQRAMA